MTEAQSPRQRIRVAVQSLHRELDSQPILQGIARAPLHGKAAYLRSLRFLLPYWQTFAHFDPAGQLTIESEPGKGTRVEAQIPLAVNRMDIQKPVAGLLVN